jgi:hypothetical protein
MPASSLRNLVTALVLLGLALRVWAYAGNPPLWLDETLVARNIFGLSLRELLTQPLQLDQVAPRGFLLMEKLAVLAFGRNELAVRLFPFLCSIAGVFLFRSLAERALEGWAVPFAVGLFAIGIPFIKHAAEVKQYELDPAAAVCLMLLSLWLRERDSTTSRLLLAGLAGFVITWFSQPSVIVMGGIGVALAVEWCLSRDLRTARMLLTTVPIWALSSVVAIWAGLQSMAPSTKEFMQDFWNQGFVPRPLRLLKTAGWFWDQGLSVFTDPTLLRYRWPAVFLLVAPFGLVAMWRWRRDVALLLAGPVVVAILAALLQQYPFRGRLIFYLIPSLLLAISAWAEWIRRMGSRLHPALGGALMIALAAPPVAAGESAASVRHRAHSGVAHLPATPPAARRRRVRLPPLTHRCAVLRSAPGPTTQRLEHGHLRPQRHPRFCARRGSVSRDQAPLGAICRAAPVPLGAGGGSGLPEYNRCEAGFPHSSIAHLGHLEPRAVRSERARSSRRRQPGDVPGRADADRSQAGPWAQPSPLDSLR